jgi:chromosome segregation ATPase
MRKIFPENSSGIQKRGDNKSDNVDKIVDNVQDDVDRLLSETNSLLTNVHNNAIRNVELTRNKEGKGKIPFPMKSVDSRNDYNDLVRQFNRADSSEEVKLSHEIFNNEKEIACELQEKYSLLQSQLEEYYRLYQQSNQKLKDTETRYFEVENKMHHLEEEKINLEEELQKKQLYGQSFVNSASQNNNTNAFELQKRSEDLRKLLLFENDDDDDIAISLNDFFKGKSLWTILQGSFNYFVPFKRDIRTIQSRYGTSVASYFLFYRFL